MNDGDAGEEHYRAQCDWCHFEVLNFVQPPAMVEVDVDPGPGFDKESWRICWPCYTELIKLIARLPVP